MASQRQVCCYLHNRIGKLTAIGYDVLVLRNISLIGYSSIDIVSSTRVYQHEFRGNYLIGLRGCPFIDVVRTVEFSASGIRYRYGTALEGR